MDVRACEVCGTEFVPSRSRHVLCSNRCAVKRHYQRFPRNTRANTECVNRTLGHVCTCARCRQMTLDRRPWLILSAREARALQLAALSVAEARSPDLARALRQIDLQLRWVAGAADGEEPNQMEAVLRDRLSA